MFLFLALMFACGGGAQDVAAPVPPPVAEPAPKLEGIWADMDLPLADGDVTASVDTLMVAYREGAAADRLAAWSSALEGHGWVLQSDLPGADQTTRTYEREGRLLILAVSASDGRISVSAQDLGAI